MFENLTVHRNRLTAILVALMVMLLVMPTEAQAAAKRKVVPAQLFAGYNAWSSVPSLKVKRGTNRLKYKEGYGYVTFTAPKTKTYTFKFSGFKKSTSIVTSRRVKTKGGKVESLYLSKKAHVVTDIDSGVKTTYGPSFKVKLKKGAKIRIYLVRIGYSGYEKANINLKIK